MRSPTCPVCRKAAVADYRPFCSRRCADVDLQRWLAGVHRLHDDPDVDDDDAPVGPGPGDPSDEA